MTLIVFIIIGRFVWRPSISGKFFILVEKGVYKLKNIF